MITPLFPKEVYKGRLPIGETTLLNVALSSSEQFSGAAPCRFLETTLGISFDHKAWDAWRRRETEAYGNDPAGWVRTANNLVASAALVLPRYSAALAIMLRNVRNGGCETDKPWTADEEETVRIGHQTHTVGLMLFAFAIECLLKALYLDRGGVLYINGRFKSPRLAKAHNLLEIAEALGCIDLFTAKEREVLDLLSARNEMGRYPVHSRHDSYGIQPPDDKGHSKFYGVWSSEFSAVVFRILQALYTALKETIPSAADSLLKDKQVEDSAYRTGA